MHASTRDMSPVSVTFDYGKLRSGKNKAPRIQFDIADAPVMSHQPPSAPGSNQPGSPPAAGASVGNLGNSGATSATFNFNSLLPRGAYQLPEFKGSTEDKPHAASFLSRIKATFALQPSLTDQHKLLAIQNSFPLGTPAASWFLSRSTTLQTFDQFERAFTDRFGASDVDIAYLRRTFMSFKQRESDSVSKYFAALLDVSTRLSLNGSVVSDDELIERFVHGLKPALSNQVFHERIRAGRYQNRNSTQGCRCLTLARNYRRSNTPVGYPQW